MDNNVSGILSILRCVQCGGAALETAPAADHDFGLDIKFSDYCLRCPGCETSFPVTHDGIPILWTPSIRESMLKKGQIETTLGANIFVYDQISDSYQKHTRQDKRIASRMRTVVNDFLAKEKTALSGQSSDTGKYHLDIGCGPGHVLRWTASLGTTQIGLDVSLSNLRNTRQSTGAYVVLGDATDIPFQDDTMHLVTESSVLHHVEQWEDVIREACRVSGKRSMIVLDSEPSKDQMDWGPAARAVFDSRWYVYKLLSYVWKEKYKFRDIKMAKIDYYQAEVHNQPGRGFPLERVENLFRESGFEPRFIFNPDAGMETSVNLSWKHLVLHLLSLHNPLNPKYFGFSVVATPANMD